MAETVRVTISLPRDLAKFADSMASRSRKARSRLIAELIEEKRKQTEIERLAEGYRALAEENRVFAEEALPLFRQVLAKEPPYSGP